MNKEISANERRQLDAVATGAAADRTLMDDAVAACRQISPLWPLKDFVAVNPMLGQTDEPFDAAAARLPVVSGARLLRKPADYAEDYRRAAFDDRHLGAAIRRLGGVMVETPAGVVDALSKPDRDAPDAHKTVSEVAFDVTGHDWSRFIVDQISFWAGGYFDEGQAAWKNPWRTEAPFVAWRAQAMIDRTPEILGLKGFRATVSGLSADAATALADIVRALGVPPAQRTDYFHRLLSTIAGWAGYRRYQGWAKELAGDGPAGVLDLLAIRASYDYAIYRCLGSAELKASWRHSLDTIAKGRQTSIRPALVAQTALEYAYQERLVEKIGGNEPTAIKDRPAAQAVFCIDVRSERIRRAIETVNNDIETFGFAGFFGFPIAIIRAGDSKAQAQCPVLLEPKFHVCETPRESIRAATFAGAWKRFKTGAISSFAFVESLGGVFAGALLRDSSRRPAPETAPLGALDIAASNCVHANAMSVDDKVALAAGAIAGISFNGRFARLIALVGHGASTTNNPYASGLDCGACGGHSGEANARTAAAVLNDKEVRTRLAARGVSIPDDTVFLAALHDTTTDEIRLFDSDRAPASHGDELARLTRDFAEAAIMTRRERGPSLGLAATASLDNRIKARSRDWSQVRPEWGLAGCAAFIAAPRGRTRRLDLNGRAFLHSYDWRCDDENAVLELIMTAPLVVASWISLQYYASSVDNRAYGSGDKTLHNVIGGIGVLEGGGGDLRSGLPMQSVHDGQTLFHQPMRLAAVIEAPRERIDRVLAKHAHVRALFDNGWMHLIAIVDDGAGFMRYGPNGAWTRVNRAEADPENSVI